MQHFKISGLWNPNFERMIDPKGVVDFKVFTNSRFQLTSHVHKFDENFPNKLDAKFIDVDQMK